MRNVDAISFHLLAHLAQPGRGGSLRSCLVRVRLPRWAYVAGVRSNRTLADKAKWCDTHGDNTFIRLGRLKGPHSLVPGKGVRPWREDASSLGRVMGSIPIPSIELVRGRELGAGTPQGGSTPPLPRKGVEVRFLGQFISAAMPRYAEG